MTERETKTITTPGGHKVELRAYLTGREANQLKELLYADIKMNTADIESGKIAIDNIPASFLVKQEEKTLEFLVVSVDGETNAPVDKVLDFASADYDAVVEAINEIRNPPTPEK